MPALDLFHRNPDKPRLSIRERFRNTAARIVPRISREHRKGGGCARRSLDGALAVATFLRHPIKGRDAELIDLVQQYRAAYEERNAHYHSVVEPAEIQFFGMKAAIPPPEALFQIKGDVWRMSSLRGLARRGPGGRAWYGGTIDELRKPQTMDDFNNIETVVGDDGREEHYPRLKTDPIAQARANEIVGAYDAWQAQLKLAEEESGLAAALEADVGSAERNEKRLGMIVEARAFTLRGLMAKAECAEIAQGSGGDALQRQLKHQLEEDGGSIEGTSLALSIAVDLLELSKLRGGGGR